MGNDQNTQDTNAEFEQMMEQRLRDYTQSSGAQNVEISDERLKEMSKKLPSWSLEPPYSYLK